LGEIGRNWSWLLIPPWVILGVLLILVPILGFVTFDTINRQRSNTINLMKEKGAALIRSFEAGARTGMMGMWGGGYQLQRLLSETAQQSDIVYLIVTDHNGVAVAHSDPSMVGKTYAKELDPAGIARSARIEWREVRSESGELVFEVFRQFAPTRHPRPGRLMGRDSPRWQHTPWLERDWNQPHAIFVGLDMEPVEASRREDVTHTVVMGAGLLLLGLAGIVSIFLAQAYRSTRTSLSKVKAFTETLVYNIPIGLMVVDRDGNIALLNRTGETLLRLKASEAVNKKLKDVAPETFSKILREVKKVPVTEREINCRLGDGQWIPLDLIATSLGGNEKNSEECVFIFRDLSEVKRLKEEVERNKRLASIGMLAAGVAHEIRNPLSSIKGFATYFRDRYRDIPEDQEIAGVMIDEVERLNRVIGQLLEFARPMSIERETVPLPVLINHTIKMIEGDAAFKGIDIKLGDLENQGDVCLDKDKIKQVLLNVYINAMEAMEKGGTLRVEATRDIVKNTVSIVVTDTGKGIKDEDLEHVFDPYFTTKPTGTGLGLALVHKIVHAHGGEVGITSRPGSGTSVTITLPADGSTEAR
jgi:two-component system sensor histidine kinase HydH